MTNKIKNEDTPKYIAPPEQPYIGSAKEHKNDKVINQALNILNNRLQRSENFEVSCTADTKKYFILNLAELEHEVFAIMFLDNRHHLINYEEMFRGTIDGASVYPREVVKRALALNAAAIILGHNHPSGIAKPSIADEKITIRLKEACKLVDIRVLDHIIVGGTDTVSLAERGIL